MRIFLIDFNILKRYININFQLTLCLKTNANLFKLWIELKCTGAFLIKWRKIIFDVDNYLKCKYISGLKFIVKNILSF